MVYRLAPWEQQAIPCSLGVQWACVSAPCDVCTVTELPGDDYEITVELDYKMPWFIGKSRDVFIYCYIYRCQAFLKMRSENPEWICMIWPQLSKKDRRGWKTETSVQLKKITWLQQQLYSQTKYVFSLKCFINFFFRQRGREGGREGEKHQCVVASCTPPTGDVACSPGMCPDWESNRRPFGSQAGARSTEPHQPGPKYVLKLVIV